MPSDGPRDRGRRGRHPGREVGRGRATSSARTKAARSARSGNLLNIFETLFLLRREHLAEFFVDVLLQVGRVLLLLVRQLERLDDRSRHDLAGL